MHIIKNITILIILIVSSGFAARNRIDSRDDYGKLSYEYLWGLPVDSSFAGSDSYMNNVWLYAGLPPIKIARRYLFSSVEVDLVMRSVSFEGNSNEGFVMQRYGLFLGYPIVKKEKHSGTFMFGTGIATDNSGINSNDWYFNFIYDHRFKINDKLTLGMGILLSYNLGRLKQPSPLNFLPTIKWKPNDMFLLHVGWDNISFKVYPWNRVGFVQETRYDLSYFSLEDYNYQYENISTGGGMDIAIGKNFSLRMRVFKSLIYRETSWNESDDILITHKPGSAGASFRAEISYIR